MKTIATLLLSLAVAGTTWAAKPPATVNGKPIDARTYDRFLQQRARQNKRAPTPEDHQAVLDELINRELLYQEAMRQKLDKDPEVAFRLEQQRINTLVRAVINKEFADHPVSDKELKQEYDRLVKGADFREFKARHILVKTEQEAEAIIKQLDKGADFATLAKEKSTGPSGKQGGDLGWFRLGQMVPPFAAAVAKLEKGKYTRTPVKTQYGWHVILLEDSRSQEPPTFEAVRSQLTQMVQGQRVQAMLKELREKAKIERNLK